MTTTRIYITFYSEKPMDFLAIAGLSSVEPTRIEVKGEPKVSHHTGKVIQTQSEDGKWIPRVYQHNAFRYDLPVSRGKRVDRVFNKLMQAIKNPAQLGAYCKEHDIKVCVQVVLEGITDTYSVPAIHLDGKFVSFLADLNHAEVDFDIYTDPWTKDSDYTDQPAEALPSGEKLYRI